MSVTLSLPNLFHQGGRKVFRWPHCLTTQGWSAFSFTQQLRWIQVLIVPTPFLPEAKQVMRTFSLIKILFHLIQMSRDQVVNVERILILQYFPKCILDSHSVHEQEYCRVHAQASISGPNVQISRDNHKVCSTLHSRAFKTKVNTE